MITDIHLQNFRSYGDESFELSSSVNIIVGPNASGKTNLLEAVLMIAQANSYRAKDEELIRFKCKWSKLTSNTNEDDERVIKIEKKGETTNKTIEINKNSYKRLSLNNTLPVVLFQPEHLQMISGSPELRRVFIDDLLEKTQVGFGQIRRQYRRALSQRNSLLKRVNGSANEQLFVWNVRLSELGSQIVNSRLKLLELINKSSSKVYSELASTKSKVNLDYKTKIVTANYATNLLKQLSSNNPIEFNRGFTLYGPHREDFQVYLNNHPIQDTASRGEIRTLMLVFKIVEANIIESAREHKPILLLDDVFGELDGARRRALTNFLQTHQSFVTTTDADVVIKNFTKTANIIPLSTKDYPR